MDNATRFPHLMKAPLLSGIATEEKKAFLNQSKMRVYHRPEEILIQGQHSQGLFVIAHGAIEVSHTTPYHHHSILCHCGPGEVVGEIEAIGETPCIASCIAQPGTTLLFAPLENIFSLLRNQLFLRNIAATFAAKMARDNLLKAVDKSRSADHRICAYLSQMSLRQSVIHANQGYLAEVVGCSRQKMNRTLGDLRDEGIISLKRGALEVLDREALDKRVTKLL